MRNKFLILILTLALFSSHFVYGQCTPGNYVLPDTICPGQPLNIFNTSNALSYNWDNGLGDLDSIPTSSILPAVGGTLVYPENMKVVFDNNKYYAFVPNALASYITKYEFGNSLNNAPIITNLPSDPSLSSFQSAIDAVNENGKWYLFVTMYSSNSMVRVEMDSINQSSNLTFTNMSIAGLNSPWSLKLTNHIGFVMNNQDDKLVRLDFNGNYSNTPTVVQPSISTGFFNNFGFDVAYDCSINSFIGYGTSFSSGAIVKFNFGNSLLNTPSTSTILSGVAGAQGVQLTQENGSWHLFVACNSNNFYNYSLGNSLINAPTLLYSTTFNGNLSDPKNIQLFKDGNNWIGLLSNTSSFNIVKVIFPSGNSINNQFSTEASPSTISFSPTALGYQRIELREDYGNGNYQVYLDSVFVNIAPPQANFAVTNLCINDSVSFNDSSTICFGNIVSWSWNFGDGFTSNDKNPKHLYQNSGIFNVTISITDNFNQTSVFSKNIIVHQKPIADFSFINNSCSGAPVLFTDGSSTADGFITNYNWTIDSNNYNSNNTSATFIAPGLYPIELVITTEFGCSDTIHKQITIEPTPIADFVVNNTCVNELTVFTNLTDSNTISNVNYAWQLGGFLGTNAINPVYQFPTGNGIYGIVLIANSPNGCADTIIKSVLIGNRPNPDFILTTDTICQNTIFTITDNSTPGSLNTISSRAWSMGDGTIINDSITFNYAYTVPGVYQIQLTVKSPTDCDSTLSKTIVVVASPSANYTVANSCLGGNNVFTDQSTSPSGTYITNWTINFGDNTQSNNPNSTHLYSIDGTYTTSLMVTSNIGCSDTAYLNAVVYPLPVANFNSGKACSEIPISFTDSSVISSGAVSGWSWNFGNNLGSSTQQNPYFSFQNNFAYPVTLISTSSYGCSDTITKYIIVEKTPVFTINTNNNCEGLFSQLNYTLLASASSNLAYLWNFGDSTSSFQPSPTHLYNTAGNFITSLEVTDLTNGCAVTKFDTLIIYPNPNTNFTFSNACIGKEVDLLDASTINNGSITIYEWKNNESQFATGNSTTFIGSQPGIVNMELITTSNFGCKDSITLQLTIYPKPDVSFLSDVIYGAPPLPVVFNNTSSLGNYLWNFGDGTTSSQYSPSHVYSDTGSYTINLYVANQYGCIDSASSMINVYTPIIDIAAVNNSFVNQNNKWKLSSIIENKGNITIDSLIFKINLEGFSVVYESQKNIQLTPGNSKVIYFNTSFDAGSTVPGYLCTEAILPIGLVDQNVEDNSYCSVTENGFHCYNLHPNPADDQTGFAISLPEEDFVTIQLFSGIGQEYISASTALFNKGYSNISLNTKELSSGIYFIKVIYKEESETLKLLKQ